MSTLKLVGDSSGYVQLVANTAAQNNTLTLPNVNDTLANITSPTFLSNIALAGTGTAPPVGLFTPSANTLAFATNTTQVVTITSTGNLGIGTSTVSAGNAVAVYGGNLYVNGNITFGSTTLSATGITQQIFTSGTGTYTLPAGAKWIKIRMVAAGGGGGGGGTSAGTGGTGGATTFGTSFLTCNGGGGGAGSGSGSQGVGGTASGGDINVQGGYTDPILSIGTVGNNNSGRGAASAFGGGGAPGYGYSGGNSAGGGGLAYGCGGGGGGGSAAGSGSGGAGGGYLERLITSPAATYSYAVGTGGTGGTAGTSGSAGGSGGSGIIIIEEHYNW